MKRKGRNPKPIMVKNRKRKPNPKADKLAWNRVAMEAHKYGYDPAIMRKNYRKYKTENEHNNIGRIAWHIPKVKAKRNSGSRRAVRPQKFVPKKLILDDLREYRSSKIISSVSNSIAEFIMNKTGKRLTNNQKNVLRSIIALSISETFNKVFEEELDAMDKVQTFVKFGRLVYEVVLWYDEQSQTYQTDLNRIKVVRVFSLRFLQYMHFLHIHPTLNQLYTNKHCLSLEEMQSGQVCVLREHLKRTHNVIAGDCSKAPNGCPYYFYCKEHYL